MDDLDAEIAREAARAQEPWSSADYEAVRQAAVAVARGMTPITLQSGKFYAGLDGPLFWDLLAALDRDPNPRPKPGRPVRR